MLKRSFILCLLIALLPLPVAAIETAAEQVIIKDLSTDTVLFEKNADEEMPTSSMSKVMTMYAVFEALDNGRLSLEDTLPVSEKAWRKGGSKMFVEVGKRVAVEDLIRGVIVQSGNDATIVLAEGLAGSEEAFAERLTRTAKRLGMDNSNFTNASGWPDPDHYSTARDLATLAEALVTEFPQYYHYYSEKEFVFNDIRQFNRNPLVQRGVADGMKTGHTEAAGYGLIASAERDGRRLVMVLNGLNSARQRAVESERLLNWAFRAFETYELFTAGEPVYEASVWLGEDRTVPLELQEDVRLTLNRAVRDDIEAIVTLEEPVDSPIEAGARLGTLVLDAEGMEKQQYPLVAARSVARLGSLARLQAAARYLIFGADASGGE